MHYQIGVVSSPCYYGNLEGQEATIGIIDGGEETPFSAIRPYRLEVPLNEALNMSENLYQVISYLLTKW